MPSPHPFSQPPLSPDSSSSSIEFHLLSSGSKAPSIQPQEISLNSTIDVYALPLKADSSSHSIPPVSGSSSIVFRSTLESTAASSTNFVMLPPNSGSSTQKLSRLSSTYSSTFNCSQSSGFNPTSGYHTTLPCLSLSLPGSRPPLAQSNSPLSNASPPVKNTSTTTSPQVSNNAYLKERKVEEKRLRADITQNFPMYLQAGLFNPRRGNPIVNGLKRFDSKYKQEHLREESNSDYTPSY